MNSNVWPIGIWFAGMVLGYLGVRWAPQPIRRIGLTAIAVQAASAVTVFAAVGVLLVVTA